VRSAEDGFDRDAWTLQGPECDAVPPAENLDMLVRVASRVLIDNHDSPLEVHQPQLRDFASGVAGHLDLPVEVGRRIPDFDDEQTVARSRRLRSIVIGPRPQQCKTRLRRVPGADHHGGLGIANRLICKQPA
jgi:hypothetical protein